MAYLPTYHALCKMLAENVIPFYKNSHFLFKLMHMDIFLLDHHVTSVNTSKRVLCIINFTERSKSTFLKMLMLHM